MKKMGGCDPCWLTTHPDEDAIASGMATKCRDHYKEVFQK